MGDFGGVRGRAKNAGHSGGVLVAAGSGHLKNGYHDPQLRSTRGTTQGGLTSPKIFNVEVDNMVRHWLSIIVEDDTVIYDGMGHEVGRILGVFYMYNGIIG